jgi:hypothetical protein
MGGISQLNAAFVVAGGDTFSSPMHKKPPTSFVLKIYILVLTSEIMMAFINCTVIQHVTRTLTIEM